MLEENTKSELVRLLEKLDEITDTDISFIPIHHQFFIDMVKNGKNIERTIARLMTAYMGSKDCERASDEVNEQIKEDIGMILSYSEALQDFYKLEDLNHRTKGTEQLRKDIDRIDSFKKNHDSRLCGCNESKEDEDKDE